MDLKTKQRKKKKKILGGHALGLLCAGGPLSGAVSIRAGYTNTVTPKQRHFQWQRARSYDLSGRGSMHLNLFLPADVPVFLLISLRVCFL